MQISSSSGDAPRDDSRPAASAVASTAPSTVQRFVPFVLIGFGVLFALPATPLAIPTPGQDAGVFNYVAWRMLQGELPYRDVWDHKPPVIYFIAALGQFIGGGTVWGVALLQALSMTTGLTFAWFTLRSRFGALPAFLSITLAFYASLVVGAGLFMTEEFTLLYSFATIALFLRTLREGPRPAVSLGLGAITALAFLTKQILIGVQVSACIVLAIHLARQRQWRLLFQSMAWFALSALSLIALTVGYFWMRGAFREFWDAVVTYNFSYAETRHASEMFHATYIGSVYMREGGILYPAIPGLFLALLTLLHPGRRRALGNPLLWVALIDLPLELWFTALSGRAYNHYFYCWIPALTILSAVFFDQLTRGFPDDEDKPLLRLNPILPRAIAIVFVIGIAAVPYMQWQFRMFDIRNRSQYFHRGRAVELIKSLTGPDDAVLMWGSEATVNFASRRRSPTRFVFQSPLHEPFHPAEDIVQTFFRDLRNDPPALIIDTSWSGVIAPPIDPERWKAVIDSGEKQRPREGVREVADYILENYVYVGRMLNWHVYARPDFDVELPPMTPREKERYTY